jgi:hypothetical protein
MIIMHGYVVPVRHAMPNFCSLQLQDQEADYFFRQRLILLLEEISSNIGEPAAALVLLEKLLACKMGLIKQ